MTTLPSPFFQPVVHMTADDHVDAHLLAPDGGTLCGLELVDDAGWHMCAHSCHADELVPVFRDHVCPACLLAAEHEEAMAAARAG